jgi:hypothetical protein
MSRHKGNPRIEDSATTIIAVEPGDSVLLLTPRQMSEQQAETTRRRLAEAFPNVTFVFASGYTGAVVQHRERATHMVDLRVWGSS